MLENSTAFAQAKRNDDATISHPDEIWQAPLSACRSANETPVSCKPMIYLALLQGYPPAKRALFSQRKIILPRETQSI